MGTYKISALAFLVLIVIGCRDGSNPLAPNPISGMGVEELITSDSVTINSSGYAPLTALIQLQTETDTRIQLRVVGQNRADSDVIYEIEEEGTQFSIPVLGLYANYENEVQLTFFETTGSEIGTKTYLIQTEPLIEHMPTIEIETGGTAMAGGMTFVSYFGFNGPQDQNFTPQRPFIFDTYGDIRWYLDFSSHDTLSTLFYDNGMERLQNGNLYFGDGSTARIYEINMLGETLDSWDMPGYGFHHNVIEKPNGNFVISASQDGADTIEDFIIEIDRSSKQIINVWDLQESLDYDRTTWTEDREDWIHVNALAYDESDNTIIISGRTQGVIKLNGNNEVVWVLGPHEGWGEAGNGVDLNQFLLRPLDLDGQPIADTAVVNGSGNHPEFEWNWYQHSPKVMPNGNIILFDNGDNRNYTGDSLYSRAVEFAINADSLTVQQVWTYGKDRGEETYSRIVSEVDYLADENHVVFSPGAIAPGLGKIIEVDYDQQQVLFEATITPPQNVANIAFHRSERLSLYP